MKIKLKDAMKLAKREVEEYKRLDALYRAMEDYRRNTYDRMYELEKRIASLEMKLAEMNGEVNKPGCDNACACEPKSMYF